MKDAEDRNNKDLCANTGETLLSVTSVRFDISYL